MDTESYTVLFIVNCSEVVRVDVSSTYPVNFDRSALMLPYRICWIQSVPGLCGDILLLKFPFLYNPVFIELETYPNLPDPRHPWFGRRGHCGRNHYHIRTGVTFSINTRRFVGGYTRRGSVYDSPSESMIITCCLTQEIAGSESLL